MIVRVIVTLAEAISALAHEIRGLREQRKSEFDWIKSHHGFATKQDLIALGEKIMSKISEFMDKLEAHNTKQEAAIEDIAGDVKFLTDKIVELQNSPGTITPEDQARLDAMESRAAATTAKLEALAALTPPAPPPPPA